MRIILLVSVLLFVSQAYADLTDLINAIKANDIELVKKLLAEKNKDHSPVVTVNDIDDAGRRPIFFATSAEMFRELFALGATLHDGRFGSNRYLVYVDAYGMNPLHYLLAFTARHLLEDAQDDLAVGRQIEEAALLLIRAQYQERAAGWLRDPQLLELQQETEQQQQPDYFLPARIWREEFVARLTNAHLRWYDQPQDGYAAAAQRKKEKLRQLVAEEQRLAMFERRRQNDRRLVEMLRLQELERERERLLPPALVPTLVGPILARPIMRGPQAYIDSQSKVALFNLN